MAWHVSCSLSKFSCGGGRHSPDDLIAYWNSTATPTNGKCWDYNCAPLNILILQNQLSFSANEYIKTRFKVLTICRWCVLDVLRDCNCKELCNCLLHRTVHMLKAQLETCQNLQCARSLGHTAEQQKLVRLLFSHFLVSIKFIFPTARDCIWSVNASWIPRLLDW